ncbi:Mutator family transposase [Planctomycetales bacterium 10988]|nr:Mutator family transposase [Planctomycetales bacterium 10988]QGJ68852.1 Mutator family transposase [Planctomycetales bacterium 10988]
MTQSTTQPSSTPADGVTDPEVLAFRQPSDSRSPLDEIVREGARRMLQAAIDAEVEVFLSQHEHRRDEQGRRQVVKNGRLPERKILTGAGPIPVTQGRARDKRTDPHQRVTFTPSVLPSYLRKTTAIEAVAVPQRHLDG